ncbi:MAG: PAS domain-containing sensor histidine kinase [Dehalococcoidales bacterium]
MDTSINSQYSGISEGEGHGITIGPFTGGNETEWTRYLEKLLKSQCGQFIGMLEAINEGVAVIDPKNQIIFMNPSMVREFGSGIGDKCYKHIFGRDRPCRDICRLPSVLDGNTERWEYTLPDGRTYDVVASPFMSTGGELCALVTLRNISIHKQFEIDLVKVTQLKSELLKQKAEQLEKISCEVARLEEEKVRFVRFLGVVAHDLQSPLVATQTFLWQVLDGFTGDITQEQQDILEKCSNRIDRLMRLIKDLLDIPRIETGQLVSEMKPMSLLEIVKDSAEELESLARDKGMTIQIEAPTKIAQLFGSAARIQQVVENLISNAIKYSDSGDVIVKVSEKSNEVKVEVIDSGTGISSKDLTHVFDDFFRAKATAQRGTGLGLSICKRIIEAHSGKIRAESPCLETGKGSKFSFTLPRKEAGKKRRSNKGTKKAIKK